MFTPIAGVVTYSPSLAHTPRGTASSSTSGPRKAQWQPDHAAIECPICSRRFSTFVRKHHCRVCGRVVCYQCSLSRAVLGEDVCVNPPDGVSLAPSMYHRVCDDCMRQTRLIDTVLPPMTQPHPINSTNTSSTIISKAVLEDDDGAKLLECPVCLRPLASSFASDREREDHVNTCLMGVGASPAGFSVNGRYLVYTLKDGSALVGMECVICFEEFTAGERIARLECLCNYHRVSVLVSDNV